MKRLRPAQQHLYSSLNSYKLLLSQFYWGSCGSDLIWTWGKRYPACTSITWTSKFFRCLIYHLIHDRFIINSTLEPPLKCGFGDARTCWPGHHISHPVENCLLSLVISLWLHWDLNQITGPVACPDSVRTRSTSVLSGYLNSPESPELQ